MTRSFVEAAQRGDHGAFEALAIARVDRLYGGARLILRDVHLAEDAVQETLIRAWQQLPRLRDVDKLMRGTSAAGQLVRRSGPIAHVFADRACLQGASHEPLSG